MFDYFFLQKIILAISVGALIGLERQYSKKRGVLGIRTFSLLSLIATMTVILSKDFLKDYSLVWIGFSLISVFSVIFYLYALYSRKGRGFTTNTAVIITYLLGVFVGFGMFAEAVFLSIVTSVILFSKERMHELVKHMTGKEVGDLLEFLIVLGIVYPLLPEKAFVLGVELPLLKIWSLVILVSVINFTAFILSRKLSAKMEVEVVGFLGGIASSTATFVSLTNLLKGKKNATPILSGAFFFINSASILRNFMLMIVLFPPSVMFLGAPLIITVMLMLFFGSMKLKGKKTNARLKIDSPFNAVEGVKLGLVILVLFLFFGFFMKFVSALTLFSLLGGLINSSAVVISLISLVSEGMITARIAAELMIIAQAGSFITNSWICYFYHGKKVIKNIFKEFIFCLIVLAVSTFLLVHFA